MQSFGKNLKLKLVDATSLQSLPLAEIQHTRRCRMGSFGKNFKLNLVDATSLQSLPLAEIRHTRQCCISASASDIVTACFRPDVAATCFLLPRPQTSPIHHPGVSKGMWQHLFQEAHYDRMLHHHLAMATVFDVRCVCRKETWQAFEAMRHSHVTDFVMGRAATCHQSANETRREQHTVLAGESHARGTDCMCRASSCLGSAPAGDCMRRSCPCRLQPPNLISTPDVSQTIYQ